MLEIESTDHGCTAVPEVAKTATKTSPAPLEKHSPGGYTVYRPRSNSHRQGGCRFAWRYSVSFFVSRRMPRAHDPQNFAESTAMKGAKGPATSRGGS